MRTMQSSNFCSLNSLHPVSQFIELVATTTGSAGNTRSKGASMPHKCGRQAQLVQRLHKNVKEGKEARKGRKEERKEGRKEESK